MGIGPSINMQGTYDVLKSSFLDLTGKFDPELKKLASGIIQKVTIAFSFTYAPSTALQQINAALPELEALLKEQSNYSEQLNTLKEIVNNLANELNTKK